MCQTVSKAALDYYKSSGPMTQAGNHGELISGLPDDIGSLAKIIQGLIIHPFTSKEFFGYDIPKERMEESNFRRFSEIIDGILKLDNRPLNMKRDPDKRLVGVCHHFSKFLVSVLRSKGIPARMRYGFGGYFNPGFFEDHSVCEYWDEKKGKWLLADPQFDETWIRELKIVHDILDVPRDSYFVAGKAWIECRAGRLDPESFGLSREGLSGWWIIAGNIVKDAASLNKMEMLPWDAWKAIPRPNNSMRNKKLIKFFDELSILTLETDESFDDLRKIYLNNCCHIRVPGRVFNAMHRRLERVTEE